MVPLRSWEHKATPVRRAPAVTDQMRVQLALQADALRAAGHRIAGAAVWFTSHRVRIAVPLDEAVLALARSAVAATRATIDAPEAPPPLVEDPRCGGCSHVSVCLPDERAETAVPRRILAADPDAQIVHVVTPGARASLRGGRLLVHAHDGEVGSVPLERVEGLVIHDNADVSGALIRELQWRSVPLVWCTWSGRVVGWATSAHGPNGGARVRQREQAADGRLDLARELVGSKIANQATLLRRNGDASGCLARLRLLARRTASAPSREGRLVPAAGVQEASVRIEPAGCRRRQDIESLDAPGQAGRRCRGRSTSMSGAHKPVSQRQTTLTKGRRHRMKVPRPSCSACAALASLRAPHRQTARAGMRVAAPARRCLH